MIQKITKPQEDDKHLLGIIFGLTSAQALYVAHDLKLFPTLAQKPMSFSDVCETLELLPRPTQSLLSMCASQKLIQINEFNKYELTQLAKDYLLEDSPTYFGGILDQGLQNSEIFSFESLKNALTSNSSQVYGGADLFDNDEKRSEQIKTFTRCMHSKSMAAATAWPETLDLSGYGEMLDIGGGSGAHSIGAVSKWPDLQAVIFDRPLVCSVASEFINSSNLQKKITIKQGDMWEDDFPKTDLHFYSDIYHDWPPERCEFLTSKSFENLNEGGRIIIHEMLFNDQKTGPLSVAAYNVRMMQWTEGQQFSAHELTHILSNAGFSEVEVHKTGFGDWQIVTGVKAKR